jgi:hypothetical protein
MTYCYVVALIRRSLSYATLLKLDYSSLATSVFRLGCSPPFSGLRGKLTTSLE